MSALTPEDFDDDGPIPDCSCEDCEEERVFAALVISMAPTNIDGGIQL